MAALGFALLWFFQILSRRCFSPGVSNSDLGLDPLLLLLLNEKPRERGLPLLLPGDAGPAGPGGLFIVAHE